MFKFFENLVDPYVDYVETDTPPRKLWPFLLEYARPFRRVFAITIHTRATHTPARDQYTAH